MHTKWNHKVVLLTVITFLAATFAMSASWSKGLGLFASAASESRAGETPLVVLYDQNNNAGSQSTSSQNFETGFDNFDDFLGDDFVVPAGQAWNVNQIAANGVYFNGAGPATSFNVLVYPHLRTPVTAQVNPGDAPDFIMKRFSNFLNSYAKAYNKMYVCLWTT